MTDDYDTEAARDWRAEDRAGAAAMPAPTKAEKAAILLALDAENADADEDGREGDPLCERCRGPLNLEAGDFQPSAHGGDVCDACYEAEK